MNADRVGAWLIAVVSASFVLGLVVIARGLPDPSEGPTPPGTRMAYYVLFAACLIAFASIPLVMWAVDRLAGGRPALAWRMLAAVGAVVAMLVLGWGVRTWAYPPHDLRQCFPEYRGNSSTVIERYICEHGLTNLPLGERRLGDGVLGAFIVLLVTGAAVARMALPPRARPSAPGAPPARGRAGAR